MAPQPHWVGKVSKTSHPSVPLGPPSCSWGSSPCPVLFLDTPQPRAEPRSGGTASAEPSTGTGAPPGPAGFVIAGTITTRLSVCLHPPLENQDQHCLQNSARVDIFIAISAICSLLIVKCFRSSKSVIPREISGLPPSPMRFLGCCWV